MPAFLQPSSLSEAWSALKENEDVRFLAGGTDLIVLMRQGAVKCGAVMDVKKIPELSVFGFKDGALEIGGAVTCAQILEAHETEGPYGILKQAAVTLANSLLRNRATLAGNLCNASPGGDMIPASLVLGASVVAASPRGEREIPLKDFFLGVKKHVLARDEIVLRVVFPKIQGGGVYLKKRRIRGHDLAQVGVAGFYDGGLRFALGAVGPTPVLVDFGRIPEAELLERKAEIVETVAAEAKPITDIRASKEYRLAMTRLFAGRILDALSSCSRPLAVEEAAQ
ncbi:MAG: FAD binding domain-containing protein [Clostridiales bacterium]|nr:FAD binding domain-containing protein [Clostridiales bacterium]